MEDRPQRVQRGLGDVLIGPLREGVGLGQGVQPSLLCQELCQKIHALKEGGYYRSLYSV